MSLQWKRKSNSKSKQKHTIYEISRCFVRYFKYLKFYLPRECCKESYSNKNRTSMSISWNSQILLSQIYSFVNFTNIQKEKLNILKVDSRKEPFEQITQTYNHNFAFKRCFYLNSLFGFSKSNRKKNPSIYLNKIFMFWKEFYLENRL